MNGAWFIDGYTSPPNKGDDFNTVLDFAGGKAAPFTDMFGEIGYKLWTGKPNQEIHSVTYGNSSAIRMNTWDYYDPITLYYSLKGDTPFNFAGWYRLEDSSADGSYWLLTNAANYEIDAQDLGYIDNGTLFPVFYKKSGATTIKFKKVDGVVSKDNFTVAMNGGTMYSVVPPTRENYVFNGYFSQENGKGTKYYDENGVPVIRWNQSVSTVNLYAYWTPVTYMFDLNGFLDGVEKGNISNYGTCDIYLDGVKVTTGAIDYYEKLSHGTRYEIKNIQAKPGKRYVGVKEGALSGTIVGTTRISLSFRTETWEDYAATSYAGGIGTETNPYIIKTAEQLGKLAKDSRTSDCANLYYKLGGNINLSAHIWPGIGNEATKFAGNFNGNMYTTSNIKTSIDYYKPKEAGLFGYVKNPAIIQNLIMKGGLVTGESDSGVIVGGNDTASIIKNCIVDGVKLMDIPGNRSAGGIAGRFTGGTIISCIYMNGTIESVGTAAGICGWKGTIEDCAVINCVISTGWDISNRDVSIGWSDNATIRSSYGNVTTNNSSVKRMYGAANAWGNWSYHSSLNGGYPVQKTLFHIGGITGSQNVYYYLKNTLNFT